MVHLIILSGNQDRQYRTDFGTNIKIYRSNTSNNRWRFCLIDQELALAPNSWTDCYFDHIAYMLDQDPANPYINVWLKSLQNERFRNYFINRYA
ncbi:MAG: hypothetical protein IPN94_02820, partial [Sphingobacteriales bacterium]|nr:hypothetical protein [Sphingobacteriales bacterium]